MSNSQLTRVQKRDKNGKLVTRWVRDGNASQKVTSAIPAPSTGQVKQEDTREVTRRQKVLDRLHKMSFNPKKLNVHPEPLFQKFESKKTYGFTASDNDFYTVMEQFTPDDTVVLMNAGLTAEKVRDVKEQGKAFKHRSADNTKLVGKLRERGIRVKEFYEAYSLCPHQFWQGASNEDMELGVDAAECLGLKMMDALGKDKFQFEDSRLGVAKSVAYDELSLSDIKAIGDSFVSSFADFVPILKRIHRGESACTAEELAAVLKRFDDDVEPQRRFLIASTARLARTHGAAFVGSLKRPHVSFFTEDESSTIEDMEKSRDFLKYADDVSEHVPAEVFDFSFYTGSQDVKDFRELWEADIPVQAALDGLEQGMNARQIIAVHQEGVAPSVSDGWL